MRTGCIRAVLGALALTVAFATSAQADPVKCQATISKETLKFSTAKLKSLQKCSAAVLIGKLPPATDCHTESKAQAGITKAVSKLHAGIAKACGGLDKNCTTTGDGNDNLATPPISWPASCPGIEGGICLNPITNCEDVATCIECIGESAVDQLDTLYHDAMLTNVNPLGSVQQKCQSTISKSAAKFFAGKAKILNKCWGAVEKGLASAISCENQTDSKTQASIAKAESKKISSICKACGGVEKLCDNSVTAPSGAVYPGSGSADDTTLGDIGAPASCDAVTVPVPPNAACAQAISTLADYIECIDCVTEFKVDCIDSAAQPDHVGYPTECEGAPLPCPDTVDFIVQAGSAGVLDAGFTGFGHDATVPTDGKVTIDLNCPGTTRPCGTCPITGPIPNADADAGDIHNKRCTGNTRIKCDDATGAGSPDCTGNGTCQFYFGTPLALAAGGVSTCVTNQFVGTISGTANVEDGSSAGSSAVIATVYSGPTLSHPCPRCLGDGTNNDGIRGGSCDSGVNVGLTCDVNGTSPNAHFGDTSLDCPPLGGGSIAALPIDLSFTTGTKSKTLSAASPNCRAPGFTTLKCFCDTCNNLAATPCDDDADCIAVGATDCGGKRCIGGANAGTACVANSECPGGSCNVPGEPTKPNACADANCDTDLGDNQGECSAGPFDQFCLPSASFRSCTGDGDCMGELSCSGGANAGAECAVASECPGSSCVADTCTGGGNRKCFLDNGVVTASVTSTGVADTPVNDEADPTVASLFCVGPTSSGAVNAAGGIPGLGRVALPGHARGLQ